MAYAAVISLKHTVERLINSTNPEITRSAYQELELLKNVLKRLELLKDVLNRLDDASSKRSRVIYGLDAQIREAVSNLEDVLQSYVLHLSLSSSDSLDDKGFQQISYVDEEKVKEEINLFLATLKKLEDEYIRELDDPVFVEEDDAVLLIDDSGGNKSTTVVGLSDQFEKIGNELLDLLSELKIVSLVGMAGIGKTLLARKLYQRSISVRYFKLTAWVSVGPKRQVRDVLEDILAQIEQPLYKEEDTNGLAQHLYQSLYGQRYIIVLDDIWNTGVWDYLMRFFPNNKNGSRLLLTTRREKIAYPTTYRVHTMRFLSSEESWNLFWPNLFDNEDDFSHELEKAGRKIAENCEGLPLLILAVAKILRHPKPTVEQWKKIAANKKSATFTEAYEKISKVLFSSYEYLPQYLKPCFLYMGVFPQTCEIPLSKLINLWAVDDFLEPNQFQKLEDFAMECVDEIVSQSLALISKHKSNSEIKSLKLHSAYWYLSVREAKKNKFLHVLNNVNDADKDCIESQRRLSVQNNILFGIREVCDLIAEAKLTSHSLLCTGQDHQYPVRICLDLILLKVLDALTVRFYEFPNEVLKLLQLRYFALTHNGKLSSFISKLQNLQILIVRQYHNIKFLSDSTRSNQLLRDSTCLPKELWDMQELRHVQIMGCNLPDPSDAAVLPNLLTLYMNAHSCTEDVFRSIPCLKKLGIEIEFQPDATETISCFEHIGLLDELRSLKCVVVNPYLRSQVIAPPHHHLFLPRCLLKLCLKGLGYSWENMSTIGSLPNLQVLKLRCYAFRGAEWETKVGEFPSLQYLLLEDLDLVHWTTDDEKCFPYLKCLIIRHCYKLNKIPWQIEEIATLKTMEIVDCSPSVVDSAQRIQKGQMYYGNDSLQVPITSSSNIR